MKSIAKLRAAGFTVFLTTPDEAEGCTKVTSAQPFEYFNPASATTPKAIYESLKPAKKLSSGDFGILIAQRYVDELPLEIVTADARKVIETHYFRCEEADLKIAELENQLEAAKMAADEAFVFSKSAIEKAIAG